MVSTASLGELIGTPIGCRRSSMCHQTRRPDDSNVVFASSFPPLPFASEPGIALCRDGGCRLSISQTFLVPLLRLRITSRFVLRCCDCVVPLHRVISGLFLTDLIGLAKV